MRKIIFAILGFLLLAHPTVASMHALEFPLEFAQIADTEFGKQLADTINLQISTGDGIDTILKMLYELRDALKAEGEKDAKEYKQEATRLNKTIDDSTSKIEKSNSEANDAASIIVKLTQRRIDLKKILDRQNPQLQKAVKARQSYIADNDRLTDEYTKRAKENNDLFKILGFLIDQLTDKVLNSPSPSLIEVKTLLQKFEKVQMISPIAAMVQVTSTFDRKLVSRIITKLEKLRNWLQDTIDKDAEANDARLSAFAVQLKNMEDSEADLSRDIRNNEAERRQAKSEITSQESRKKTNLEIAKSTGDILKNAKETLKKITKEFKSRRTTRKKDLTLVELAIETLEKRKEDIKRETEKKKDDTPKP